MDWLKLYAEWAFDPKVQSMPEKFQRRHAMLMCFHKAGMMPGLTDLELAKGMGINRAELALTKLMFVAKGFIDESWKLRKWERRQQGMSESRERVARYRGRYRNATETLQSRDANATETLHVTSRSREERRGEEKREEGEGTPLPPTTIKPLGPEYRTTGLWAEEVTADPSMCRWVDDQGRLGHPAHWIRAAIERGLGAGKRDRRYFAAILRGWTSEGDGPPESNGVYPSDPPRKPGELSPELEAKVQAWEAKNAKAAP